MAFELSRIDRLNRSITLATYFPGRTPITAAQVALLAPRSAPNASTVWYTAAVASDIATVLLAGPDADPTGAIVVAGSADLWVKITASSEVDAAKVERITVLGGGTVVTVPNDRGLPAGGTTGQVLTKASAIAYDAEWAAPTGGSGGGAVSSVNTKTGAVVLTADDIADGTAGKILTATERTKLAGVATGATANATDATLLARANHTGTQAATTITGLATVATTGAYADLSGKPAIPTVPVQSVNGKTGAVVLNTTDVGAVSATGGGLEALSTAAAAGSAYAVDLAAANVHDLKLTAANCTLTFTGATVGKACSLTLLLRQDATGGRTVTWPGSVNWGAAGAPILSTAGDAVDVGSLLTVDGGVTWLGFHAAGPSSSGASAVFSGAKVRPSASDGSGSGAFKTISFAGTESWDTDAYHETSTNNSRLTVPGGKAGYVDLKGQVEFSANATGVRQARIVKNGVTVVGQVNMPAAPGVSTIVEVSCEDIAIVGDYYEVICYQDSGAGLDVVIGGTWFSIRLLGAVA